MPDSQTKTDGAVHLTTADFAQTLSTSNNPIMVDFFANWCGPCMMAAPIIDKLAKEYDGKVLVAKVDVDDNNEIAKKYGVMSIPTVLTFKKNAAGEMELADRQVGFPGEDGYRKMITKLLA